MKNSVWWRFICLFYLLTIISGCGGSLGSSRKNFSSGNNVLNENKTAVTSNATFGSDDARSAYQSLFARSSYRLHTVSLDRIGANTAFTTYTTDYAAPDRHEFKGEGNSAKNSDIILIGQDTWVRQGDRPWKKTSFKFSALKDDLKAWLDKINDKNSEVKLIGTESLDGTPTNVYQISYNVKDEEAEMTNKGTGKVWTGTTDGLPHKAEVEGQTEKSKSYKSTTTYDYNANIKIEQPM